MCIIYQLLRMFAQFESGRYFTFVCIFFSYHQMPVSAMTWGHNDRRVFVATGSGVQVARAWRRVGSLQLLARLRVRSALRRPAHLAHLPLPPRLAGLVASLFTHTISVSIN